MYSAKIASKSVSRLAPASALTVANPSEATTTCISPFDRPSNILYYIFLSMVSSLRLSLFSVTSGQVHGVVFFVWFSRSGLGRRLTSYARLALTRGMFYFSIFFSSSITNQRNGGFLMAQGRRSSSSLDERPAHTDFPQRLSYSRFLCHVGLPCTEQNQKYKGT